MSLLQLVLQAIAVLYSGGTVVPADAVALSPRVIDPGQTKSAVVGQKSAFLSARETAVERNSNSGRWDVARARAWFSQRGWQAGANFIPSSAVNQLEMWQAATFDERTIERELGLGAGLGMRVMRVFLHDLAFKQDPAGFLFRVDRFLYSASKFGITTMFVLFDGCWAPQGAMGMQPAPLPNTHNSRWLQSPTKETLEDTASWYNLEQYVKGVIGRFGGDARVHSWDLYNEADQQGLEKAMMQKLQISPSTAHDIDLRYELLRLSFIWAREVQPTQPLTAGEWDDGKGYGMEARFRELVRAESDIGTFHIYASPELTEWMIGQMRRAYAQRPLIMTEYMARCIGSTATSLLPVAQRHGVSAICWGLVAGKTNTIWPWWSWSQSMTGVEPNPWFHDLLRPDGSPYDANEAALFRQLTGAGHQAPVFIGRAPQPHDASGLLADTTGNTSKCLLPDSTENSTACPCRADEEQFRLRVLGVHKHHV